MALKAAYIVPHPPLAVPAVGHGEERKISATLQAYREVARRIASHEPDTIVFISPHSAFYSDWIYIAGGEGSKGSLAGFGASQIRFSLSYNVGFREALIASVQDREIPAGPVSELPRELDHGVMVPLFFISQEYAPSEYKALSIGGSGLPAAVLLEFGRCIAQTAASEPGEAVLVVSGDLSHKLKSDGPYGFDPAGPAFDAEFADIVRSGDSLRFALIDPQVSEDAAECGLSGFIMLAGALDEVRRDEGAGFSSELLSLEGPFGVGYGVAAYERRQARTGL